VLDVRLPELGSHRPQQQFSASDVARHAVQAGDTTQEAAEQCVVIGNRVVALLTRLIR
jgi:hypothetical protein